MGRSDEARVRAATLACWAGPVEPEPITGGISNHNFVVRDGGARFFVRLGDDVPVHGVARSSEVRASRAAYAAGVSPELVHVEPGALVFRHIEGRTLTPEDVRDPGTLERIVRLLVQCHRGVGARLRGAPLMFWVFHAIRDYAETLRERASPHTGGLHDFVDRAARLEAAVGPVEIRFGHNDLLAANLIDDGRRLWLVDWEFAGYNSPLFDLAGLASNSELGPDLERRLLESYFGRPADDDLVQRYEAMKCASLLREALWSMAQEITSTIDFDFATYTATNLDRFERAWARCAQSASRIDS